MQHPSTFYGTYGNQKSQLHSPSKTLQAWQSQMGTWVYRRAPNILREEKNIPYRILKLTLAIFQALYTYYSKPGSADACKGARTTWHMIKLRPVC
jgi:hypothetical protein